MKKELPKIMAKMMKRTSANVTGKGDRGPSSPSNHQVVELVVSGLLDFNAIPNVMSDKLGNKLRLELSPTKRIIIVADGNSRSLAGRYRGIPVIFSSILKRVLIS